MATPKRKKNGGGGGSSPKPKPKPQPTVLTDPAAGFDMLGPATRDVRLTIHPQIEALHRLQLQTLGQYRNMAQRSNSVFGQELGALAPLAGQYGGASQAILGNLSDALGAFGGSAGGNAAENAAAGTAQDASARGFLGVLGAGQSSDLASLQAARTGAAMQRQEMGTDIASQRQDALDQIMSQRQDVFGQMPALIRQRESELQQQAFERSLAQRQFGLNKQSTLADIKNNTALQDFLKNNLASLLGGGGGGFGGPGFPGNSGSGTPGGGVNTPGGRGDTAGHGRGNTPGGNPPGGGNQGPVGTALQEFAGGHRPWAQVQDQGRQQIRGNINDYWINHPQDPAFAPLQHYAAQHPNHPTLPASMHTPQYLINLLRQYLYGPHNHKAPL